MRGENMKDIGEEGGGALSTIGIWCADAKSRPIIVCTTRFGTRWLAWFDESSTQVTQSSYKRNQPEFPSVSQQKTYIFCHHTK